MKNETLEVFREGFSIIDSEGWEMMFDHWEPAEKNSLLNGKYTIDNLYFEPLKGAEKFFYIIGEKVYRHYQTCVSGMTLLGLAVGLHVIDGPGYIRTNGSIPVECQTQAFINTGFPNFNLINNLIRAGQTPIIPTKI